ncbi:MAG: hypothetical protein K2Y20_00060 [Sphingomonas sp.]|jgi:hypothetical protein|nr:hypothetical protein [Sphingomonas sp.]
MSKTSTTEANIAAIRALIDGPDSGLADIMAEHPWLGSVEDARDDLRGILEGLEDVRAGRVVDHAEVVRQVNERSARYRSQAAE